MLSGAAVVLGGLWAGAAFAWGPTLHALAGAVFGTILLGIAITDARRARSVIIRPRPLSTSC